MTPDMADAHETARARDERASTVTYEVHMCTEGNADFDHVINCPALHTLRTRTHAINPETGEFTRLDQESDMTDHRAEAERIRDDERRVVKPSGTRMDGAIVHALLAIDDTLTEIRDGLPERVEATLDWLDEPASVPPRPDPACVCGSVDDFHLPACYEPAPADVDPDEAWAKVLEAIGERPGGDYLAIARAAREHIEANPVAHEYVRDGSWESVAILAKARAEKAESDLARVTEQRDEQTERLRLAYDALKKAEAKADRYDALRADVDEFQYKHRAYAGTWELVDALARDTEWAES